MPEYTAAHIAELVNARLEGDGGTIIRGVAPAGAAGPDHLTFVERRSILRQLEDSAPGAVLVREGVDIPDAIPAILRVDHPGAAFARSVTLFHPDPPATPGVHPTAVVGPGVEFGNDVSVGPHVVLEDGVVLGDRSAIGPSVLLGPGVRIGMDCRIRHGVSILAGSVLGDRVVVHEGARIGAEGFGFAATEDRAVRIPQVGGCLIGDDVEIGANSTIDRGALGDTSIGARTKLDNLVHVGHNVEIGEDCMIVAQVGIAGSTRVGDGVSLAGQVGLAGHLTIGDGARIAARAAVFKSVPEGATYSGTPARPHRAALRARAAVMRLPDALARLAAIERRLDDGGDDE
ncbi:MAG: UDP-3-O-(3-hydroxymyristoyl)glucosamine N-acyltransferase [Gemmatimonadota bacterium]